MKGKEVISEERIKERLAVWAWVQHQVRRREREEKEQRILEEERHEEEQEEERELMLV